MKVRWMRRRRYAHRARRSPVWNLTVFVFAFLVTSGCVVMLIVLNLLDHLMVKWLG